MAENNDGKPPSRKEVMEMADRIAAQVLAMSDEEVDAYIKEHGLEHLVDPDRVEKMLNDALVASRKKLH